MIAQEKQQQSNWCWIACFRMACSQFGVAAAQQCELAEHFLGATGCCVDGSTASCNVALPEAQITALYASVGLVAQMVPSGDVAFRGLLSAGDLVLLMFAFPASYHYVLVSQYDPAAVKYTVYDPEYTSPLLVDYGLLSTAYHQGTIARAWSVASG
jgi:hypothetical protein